MQRIRKGDEVVVLAGRDKGKRGTVLRRVDADYVIVEGVNRVKKHQRPNPMKGVTGGIVDKDMPLHISNVGLYNPATKKADRVGIKALQEGRRVRDPLRGPAAGGARRARVVHAAARAAAARRPEEQGMTAPRSYGDNVREFPGRLFIVEGIDGSGKSTQLTLLAQWLRSEGYPVVFSEWNSSLIVREATRRGKRRRILTPLTFSLIPEG